MNQFRKKQNQDSHIELTPLIDMVFILLIFYMLSSTFLKPVINLTLLVAETKEELIDENMVRVSVTKEGNIYVNNTEVTKDTLIPNVTRELGNSVYQDGIVFSSDTEVDYGFFIEIMDMLKKAGIQEISLEHDE